MGNVVSMRPNGQDLKDAHAYLDQCLSDEPEQVVILSVSRRRDGDKGCTYRLNYFGEGWISDRVFLGHMLIQDEMSVLTDGENATR